jgi:hypothetical protein
MSFSPVILVLSWAADDVSYAPHEPRNYGREFEDQLQTTFIAGCPRFTP